MGGFRRELLPDPISYFEAQGLKLAGRGKWRTTSCQLHGGSDSMRVNVESGGWVCMSCGQRGGDVLSYQMSVHDQEFVEAAQALGVYVDDGRPHAGVARPLPLSARSALQVIGFEAQLAAVAACNLGHGIALSDADRSRLLTAAARINLLSEGA